MFVHVLFENFRFSRQDRNWPIVCGVGLFTTFVNWKYLCQFQLRRKLAGRNAFIDNDWAASLMILGPMPSSPVDFEASKVLICNKTCSGVINGIVNCVFVGTLLSTKSLILLVSKSNELPDDVFSFKSSATEAKYLFS